MMTVRRMYRKEHPWNEIGKPWTIWEALGYQCVGQGSRASVYVHPSKPDVAVKVGRYDVRDAGSKRAPKDAWLAYVLEGVHWNDTKVPKVYSVTMYREFYVAVMERCYPMSWPRMYRSVKPILCNRNRFAKRLNALMEKTGLRLDLESSVTNILRRKNRQVVVTDPLYCRRRHVVEYSS